MSYYVAGLKELEVSGSTAIECLHDLAARHPPIRAQLFDSSDQPRPGLRVVIIRDRPETCTDLDATLADDEILSLLPPVAGG
jgi:molybdopterin converting factor small subunit